MVQESDAIRQIQRFLRQLSYDDPRIPQVPVDGIYESQTRQAVYAFQEREGLEVTGIVDLITWNALYTSYKASRGFHSEAERVIFFPRFPNDYRIHRGTVGFLVSVLQFMLGELRLWYDDYQTPAMTGTYDEATEKAVKVFQSKNVLPITGDTDKETWNAVALQYNTLTRDYQQ